MVVYGWLVGAAWVAFDAIGFDAARYHLDHEPEPHSYPFDTVEFFLGLMAGEAILLALLVPLRPRGVWRYLSATVIAAAFLLFAFVLSMHAPNGWAPWFLWTLAVALGLFVSTCRRIVAMVRG